MATPFDDDWIPEQIQIQPLIGHIEKRIELKGYKIKNKHNLPMGPVNDTDIDMIETASIELPFAKKVIKDVGKVGRISKKLWKNKGKRACTLKGKLLMPSKDKVNEEKINRKAFREEKKRLKEEYTEMLKKKREIIEKKKEEKLENKKKSLITTKVTNPAKLAKIQKSKKKRKSLIKI